MKEDRAVENLFILFILLILAISLAGCLGTSQKNSVTEKVDLANHPIYKDYTFSQEETVLDLGDQPIWIPTSSISEVMKRDNILKEELASQGYSLNYHPFLKGNDVNYFLLSGDLEIGIGGDMPTLRAAAAGDVVVISLIQEGPISIVSRGIFEIKDLKGKKIGYPLGSIAHFYLLNTLTKNGIDVSEVNLVQMDVIHMPEALQNGEIDAFSAWEPAPTIALNKYPELMITHRGRTYGFLYVKKDLIERNPEIVYHLLASEIRALRWLKKSDKNLDMASKWANDASFKLAPGSVLLSTEELSRLTKEDLPGIQIKEYPRIPNVLLADNGVLKKEFVLLKELGLISKDKDWEDVKDKFDLDVIETVISDPGKYKIFEELKIEDIAGGSGE